MTSIASTWRSFTFCLVVIFSIYPSLTYQELVASSRRFPVRSDMRGNGPKLSSLFQQRTATSDGSRHMSAAMAGNVTVDNISDSLVRLEEHLASLIQSFLMVQRSVFNLEQLQELLVLLLEDILKQTGRVDTNTRTAQPAYRDSDSGDKSLLQDSSDNDNSVQSTEKEGHEDDQNAVAGPDTNIGAVKVSGLNSRRVIGNSETMGSFQAIHEIMSGLNKDRNIVSATMVSGNNQVSGKEDSVEGSSEGGGSNSIEDISDFRAPLQRSTQSADLPVSHSQRPQWSEPMIAHETNNIHTRFMDIASRLGKSFSRNSSPRLLGLMNMNPISRMKGTESTFDRPPIYQPLEIVPARENLDSAEKKLDLKLRPIQIKLRQEPVISHGGPLNGPENLPSPFLEHPEDHEGIERTGERPTGMINNLMQSNDSQSPISVNEDGQHPPADLPALSTNVNGHISMPDIRRKRHVPSNSLPDTNITTDTASFDIQDTLRGVRSELRNGSSTLKQTTSEKNLIFLTSDKVITTDSSVNQTEDPAEDFNDNQGLQLDKQTSHHSTLDRTDGQEYDVLIASLLTALSTKLQEPHFKQTQSNVTATDDVVNRVALELNRLIWIPADDNMSSHIPYGKAKSTSANKEPDSFEGIIRSTADFNKATPTFMVKRDNLNGRIPETFKGRKIKSHSTGAKTMALVSINTGNKTNDNDTIFSPDQGLVTSDLQSKHSPSADTTAESGPGTRDMINNTHTEWEWLRMLKEGTEFPVVDWEWLTDALTQLSLNENLADNLRALNEKGRTLLEKKSHADRLGSSGTYRTVIEADIVASKDGNEDLDEDSNMTSAGDNSASSESDDELDENMKTVEITDQGGVHTLSETDGSTRSVNGAADVDGAKSDLDVHEDEVQGTNSNTSDDDDTDKSDDDEDDVITGDQDGSIRSVQENSNSVENIEYVMEKNSAGFLPTSKKQGKFNVPSAQPYDYLHSHAGQPAATEYLDRKLRAAVNILHHPSSKFQIVRDSKDDKMSSTRQKRQTDFLWNKTRHRSTVSGIKQVLDSQSTNAHTQQSSGNAVVGTNQKNDSISFDSRQSTHSNKTISKNTAGSSLNAGLYNEKVMLPQIDQNSAFSNPHSGNGRHYSHDTVTSTRPSDLASSQYHGQRASSLHTFNYPLSERPPVFEKLRINKPYTDSPGQGSTDPGDALSIEERSAMDLEEIMTKLFLTYWQRFYSLYTRSIVQVTSPTESEFDEEVTEMTLKTTELTLATTEAPAMRDVMAEPRTNVTSTDLELPEVSNSTSIKANNVVQ